MPEFPAAIKKIDYKVSNTKTDLIITAEVGYAQGGEPVAILDADEEIEGEEDQGVVTFNAGPAKKLIGRTIRVQTFITDRSKKTNLTIVNYRISGGLQPMNENTNYEVKTDGGRVGHFFFISFVA